MGARNTAVFGLYATREMVTDAILHFKNAGFRNTDISVMLPENEGTKDLAFSKRTKAPEGAVLGGGLGAVVGGLLGWLAATGAIAIPGMLELAAAGPVAAVLAGVGALGLAGGLIGGMAGAGLPEYEAKRYDGRVRRGGILVSVHCDNPDWVKQARKVMKHTGGLAVSSASEATGDFATAPKPSPRVRTAGGGPASPVA